MPEMAERTLVVGSMSKSHAMTGSRVGMLDIRATGLSGEDFANRLLDAEKIAVMPGESFGTSAAGHIRVAMTIGDDAYSDALTRLVQFAKGLVV